jgi:6-pyruvoyltetrahydropterin/6-carboxytetrahydropterin synthase
MEIYKVFHLESAHRLPNLPTSHKCSRLHGHSFRVEVYLAGEVDAKSGWIMDFADLKERFHPVFEALDHRYLNDVPGLENPTSENLARWIWKKLKPELPGLTKIVIAETCTSGCIYQGD